MKKGDKIYIDNKIEKSKERLHGWSEDVVEEVILSRGTVLFHISSWEKLKGFAPCITCFSPTPCLDGYTYVIILNKDIVAYNVGENEYRIDLALIDNKDMDMYYVGTIKADKGKNAKVVVDKFNRITRFNKKISFAKEFKNLANEIKSQYKEEFKISNYQKGLGYRLVNLQEIWK